jgi:GTP-binding protein
MFVDIAKIYIKAGRGGDGIVSFRTEKYVAAGGPNGGNGGKGGDVIIKVDPELNTLMDFKYQKHYKAELGQKGGANNCTGKSGEDLIIKVPPGTIIKDEATGRVLGDAAKEGDAFVVAKGGRGGRGNSCFASATRQVPKFAELGEDGEQIEILLELKLIADVGLVGFPNVGKSTILSVMTSAKPKIANYHFTTLHPNLGVVRLDNGSSFVLADIPGIIEGAHEGVGLGHEFLRHVERTRVIIHVIDISGIEERDPLEDFNTINQELKQYKVKLADKVQVIACNKMDIPSGQENLDKFKEEMKKKGLEVYPISAATGEGLKELFYKVDQLLKEVSNTFEEVSILPEEINYIYDERGWNIKRENEAYVIEGDAIKRIMRKVHFDDSESLQYFQRAIKKMGISDELEKMGIEEGDTVKIFDLEFEYVR